MKSTNKIPIIYSKSIGNESLSHIIKFQPKYLFFNLISSYNFMEFKEIQLLTKNKIINQAKSVTLNQTLQYIFPTSSESNRRLMDLEGECKIKSFIGLKIMWIKAILMLIVIVGSGIGLLLIKYFKSLRVAAFYSKCSKDQADYFFIQSHDNHQQIQKVIRQGEDITVYFKRLKYKLLGQKFCPVGYEYQQHYQSIKSDQYLSRGVLQANRAVKLENYGTNQHRVQVPTYFEYMFQVLTQPFFLLQYFVCILLYLENNPIFVYLYAALTYTTTTINYVLVYISFLKVKKMAEKQFQVRVIRNGKEQIVLSYSLVPGDVVLPRKGDEISFDGILMQGEVFVNEASLTGESIPIGKFPAQDLLSTKQQETWIYEGSKVLESRSNSKVVVINTGYTTRRGRIIRKILTRQSKRPQFYRKGIYFLFINFGIGVILYFATLHLMLGKVIDLFIGFRFMDILAWCIPPAYPIFFNLAFTSSLVRLKYSNIFGNQPQKTTESAYIKTFCFDKTGTLTQNQIEVNQVVKFTSENEHVNITEGHQDPTNSLIFKLFACCHTVRKHQGQYLGDQVDLRMYLHSKYSMSVPEKGDVKFVVQSNKQKLQVLRINQFESKFQNMSVLVRDTNKDKIYVFIKGAPERIDRNSIFKFKDFENIVASFSLGGYRTIGYGYKEVPSHKLNLYLEGERDTFEKDITALGLVAFENKLKADTRETIDKLNMSDIQPKMITGDNIYIAVETGYRAGILKEGEKVLLLEGRKQPESISNQRVFKGITIEKTGDQILKKPVQLRESEDYLTQSDYAIAIDNDFLTMTPEPALPRSVKLFARISPENKALIVRRFIQQEQRQFDSRSSKEKICGTCRWKVGMCGDGANDLMAIREADIGVGISDSDAAYGASFSISQMLHVEQIIRQAKNTSQSIVDMMIYFSSISFHKIIASIITVSDVTNLGPMALVYLNFAHQVFLVDFMILSSTSKKHTKQRPNTNMLSFKNQVLFWILVIIPTAGIVAGYFYFKNSPVFVPNAKRIVIPEKGYIGLACMTQTIMFLIMNLPFIMSSFIAYSSEPFKKKIYTNIVITVTIFGNLIAAIVIFFFPEKFPKLFFFVPIPYFYAGMVLLIVSAFLVLTYIVYQAAKKKMKNE